MSEIKELACMIICQFILLIILITVFQIANLSNKDRDTKKILQHIDKLEKEIKCFH